MALFDLETFTVDDRSFDRFRVATTAGVLECEACGSQNETTPLIICCHGAHVTASSLDWRIALPILSDAGFRAVALSFPGRDP